ncbi:hypothetical protein [Methanocalculus chunghsingensis]|nr:hypothetical protein [Methanocalculus chunghsingensis]
MHDRKNRIANGNLPIIRTPVTPLSECTGEMVEKEKKQQLVEDIRRIQETEELVELF